MSEQEAADHATLRAYVDLVRLWPLNVRYETPELYQERWDQFLTPPDGWWEKNVDRVAERLASLARGPREP